MVKLTGAGALVEFASAVDAVECAVAIQKGIAERAAGTYEVSVSSPLPRLQPASVRSAVGENGELLSGPAVVEEGGETDTLDYAPPG